METCVFQPLIERTRIDAPRPRAIPTPPPDQAQQHGLDQELLEDVMAAGADGHPQADFPRPLGHRDEHDVHDAHPAHDQRDRGHHQQQGAHQCRLPGRSSS